MINPEYTAFSPNKVLLLLSSLLRCPGRRGTIELCKDTEKQVNREMENKIQRTRVNRAIVSGGTIPENAYQAHAKRGLFTN